jgi:hypothetical protein
MFVDQSLSARSTASVSRLAAESSVMTRRAVGNVGRVDGSDGPASTTDSDDAMKIRRAGCGPTEDDERDGPCGAAGDGRERTPIGLARAHVSGVCVPLTDIADDRGRVVAIESHPGQRPAVTP